MTPLDFIEKHDVSNALAHARAAYSGTIDHHWYEPRWDKRLQKMADLIRAGETNISRVIDQVTGANSAFKSVEEAHEVVWLGKIVRANPLLMGVQRRALMNTLWGAACEQDTECIVELGSGDGINLFLLWLNGGPRTAHYHALEITRIGRLCTELLGTLEPAVHVTAHHFDYYAPGYGAIPSGNKHMLLFTNGSIEQIRILPKDVFTGLLEKAERVSGVHFEPVGWQLPGQDDPFTAAHKARCVGLGYNENLLPVLNELEREGQIVIDRTIVNIFGKPKHPTALIEWHKKEPG